MSDKVIVDGDEVYPNPYYTAGPLPEGHDWTGNIPQATQAKPNAASLMADERNLPDRALQGQYRVRNLQSLPDGRWMADVLLYGEWDKYIVTDGEMEKRKGGQKVDDALEVLA